MHHGMTFNFGSAKVCSLFETCFSYDKDTWIAATDYYKNCVLLHNCAISIDSYSPDNTFYSHFYSYFIYWFKFYFLYFNIWGFI